jgi:hypothetical protein
VMVGNSAGGFCSGTVISKRTVITAGHCWGTGVDAITRVFFEYGNPKQQKTLTVAASVRHPGYDDVSLTNDLALVKLSADALVQPAVLLRETMNAGFIGPKFAFAGYGDTDAVGNGFGIRRVVTFPIWGVGPIASIPPVGNPPSGYATEIDDTEFYYRLPDKNTCSGDSGGPAFVVRGGVERHAGVTSWGDDLCAYDGVEARTDAATMGWIQQTIDSFEPGAACRADGVCGAGCVSTSPAPLGTLDDPDCADAHCAADGVCVLSCSPVDPDCKTLLIDDCIDNGICRPGCAAPDPDCGQVQDGAACSAALDCKSGVCSAGVCCDRACGGACESCSTGACKPRAAGTECRASEGPCDVAESCDGASATCPANALAKASTVCRAAAGPCDAAELCTGTTPACPDAVSTVCPPVDSQPPAAQQQQKAGCGCSEGDGVAGLLALALCAALRVKSKRAAALALQHPPGRG